MAGCGAGIDAVRCAKLGANVQAFDLSPDMLRLIRNMVSYRQQVLSAFNRLVEKKAVLTRSETAAAD